VFGARVRQLREAQGLTQADLAAHAGVSRQLVGAVEAGRHLPRVDAAVALARSLGVEVGALLEEPPGAVDSVVGPLPQAGTPVRVGRVGDRLVCAAAEVSWDGWGSGDAVLGGDGLQLFDDARPGAVVAGCDPALGLAARLAGHRSAEPVLAVAAASADAVEALAGGRVHACVVHGREGHLPETDVAVRRWHLARWQVGLAAPADAPRGWFRRALAGRGTVVQREQGAGAQAAFERAVTRTGGRRADGPIVGGHLEAAWLAAHTGAPAVTIEPAALAAGLAFEPLETHTSQLWVGSDWEAEPGVRRLGDAVTSRKFARRLAAVGGYDLSDCGTPVGSR
jgi:DNA-binding XRE family transcriptional regulator/molybdate-binding protein